MALLITITNAGRAEIINAQHTGTEKVTITAVAFGTGRYTPSKTQTALQAEVKRVTSISGQAVAADTIHVMALDESNAAYNVGEFGLFSSTGTLVAVYSQPSAADWIIQKASASTLLLATDIILESLDATLIEFGDIHFINPPSTVDTPGVVQLEHSLTSPSNARALTAGMGKKLQDEKEPNIAAGTTAQYWRGDKGWRDFATDVRAAVLTGLSTATSTVVAAADSVLVAIGKLQAQVTGLATSKLDANANAVSATKLQTARTINGVAFDGTANITVADTTKEPAFAAGTAAQYRRGDKSWQDFATAVRASVLTGLSTATSSVVAAADSVLVAIGKLQAQVTGLATSKLDATANAVSATKLQTARTINGVVFDGTANITVADATKQPSSAVLSSLASNSAWGIGHQLVGTAVDLNEYLTSGKFITPSAGLLNLPNGWPQGRYLLDVTGGVSYSMQIIGLGATSRAAVRFSTSSTFSPWMELRTSENFLESTAAQVLAGTDSLSWVSPRRLAGIALGIGQSWQDVTASRTWATTYTNTTGKPIQISVNTRDPAAGNLSVDLYVGGVKVANHYMERSSQVTVTAIVPPGATYRVERLDTNDTILGWMELR